MTLLTFLRDVNAAIDHVFDQNLLSGAAAASSSGSRGSYNEQNAKALF